MLEIYRRLRPGEPPTVEASETLIHNLFFDPRRYDLSTVGRYKFNKKLSLWQRIPGYKLVYPVADPATGERVDYLGNHFRRAVSGRGCCDCSVLCTLYSQRQNELFQVL